METSTFCFIFAAIMSMASNKKQELPPLLLTQLTMPLAIGLH